MKNRHCVGSTHTAKYIEEVMQLFPHQKLRSCMQTVHYDRHWIIYINNFFVVSYFPRHNDSITKFWLLDVLICKCLHQELCFNLHVLVYGFGWVQRHWQCSKHQVPLCCSSAIGHAICYMPQWRWSSECHIQFVPRRGGRPFVVATTMLLGKLQIRQKLGFFKQLSLYQLCFLARAQ